MVSSSSIPLASPAADSPPLEVLPWLKSLPLAPEYHPSTAEFQDPIAYILRIEKEASCYGICKIIPPLPAPPRKMAVANLNHSLAARGGGGELKKAPPTFSTRQQQIGFCPRRPRPVQKPVWQSGEQYTLQQFEAKSKQFERAQVCRRGQKGGGGKESLTDLEVETLFWKASADKPFSVEYANDMAGSGFLPLEQRGGGARKWQQEDARNVGDTSWNMRGVSRAKGSLLKFMKEDIPGVTTPMVYVAMMFSWFAWHVEDHELHSLNYLHMGAGKTWYGVPRDARLAFEDVVRVHGYGGEVNPLVTFALLAEKTTVMSPEVLVGAGIPCCRLVQNVGEFVVTFPGAYHSGFSHGFNCGEAANIATPEWLTVAKDAAIRRASINHPPMVSHFQLLYELALSLHSRIPMNHGAEPRSSRLKDKMKGVGEMMIKEQFVQNAIQNNYQLSVLLDKGASCVVLPQNTFDVSLGSNVHIRSQPKVKPQLSLEFNTHVEAVEASRDLLANNPILARNVVGRQLNGFTSLSTSDSENMVCKKRHALQGDGLLDRGLLSCVTCGILSFACVAVVQPTDAAAVYLMSADSGSFNDQPSDLGAAHGIENYTYAKPSNHVLASVSERSRKNVGDQFKDGLGTSCVHLQVSDHMADTALRTGPQQVVSALDLLASAYGDASDSDETLPHERTVCTNNNNLRDFSVTSPPYSLSEGSLGVLPQNLHPSDTSCKKEFPLLGTGSQNETEEKSSNPSSNIKLVDPDNVEYGEIFNEPNGLKEIAEIAPSPETISLGLEKGHWVTDSSNVYPTTREMERGQSVHAKPSCFPDSHMGFKFTLKDRVTTKLSKFDAASNNFSLSFMHRPDKDSSRMHVFCLEHAIEVQKQLCPVGGVHIMLLCHPEYPKIEAEAKSMAEELGFGYVWKEIDFKEASREDQERIQSALEDEEAIPVNSDWAVKMGINLYYSANLSKSPLYSKQMAYNPVIYKAFGRDSSGGSPGKPKDHGRRSGRQKKIIVAGKWCGKVWMSNQVHRYLASRNDPREPEDVEKFEFDDAGWNQLSSDTNSAVQLRAPRRNCLETTGTTVNRSWKRKKLQEKSNAKKPKYNELETNETNEDFIENLEECGRILRRGQRERSITPVHDDIEKIAGSNESYLENDTEGPPSTRLRQRPAKLEGLEVEKHVVEKQANKKKKKEKKTLSKKTVPQNEDAKKVLGKKTTAKDEEVEFLCDMEGCCMSFSSKHDFLLHKRNICHVEGCGKKLFSHKYLMQHRRIHMDDRPLKCPWKGCRMTFKWAWARTEHIRVHTGARPYVCQEAGCGQTFRFVSDFSRHKRKTGHVSKKRRG